jgi:hypothetical protein
MLYLYITCNKKILSKNVLAYCGYSPTSSYFLLLSEHKHCYNAATNSNSEYARSRIVTSLLGSVGTGTKKDESSTGRVWAAGFYHVTAHSCLARVLKLMNRLFFFNFPNFFSGRGKPRITETADTWVRLCVCMCVCVCVGLKLF